MDKYIRLLLLVVLTKISFNAWSTPTETIIKKVERAYGEKTLKHMKTLNINESYKSAMIGQSETPDDINMRRVKRTLFIDYLNNQSQLTQSIDQREITFYTQQIFKDGLFYNINLVNNSFAPPTQGNLQQATLRPMLLHDLGLAKLLSDNPKDVKLLSDKTIKTKAHHQLELILTNGQKLKLTINKDSGLIMQSERPMRFFGSMTTKFSNIQKAKGYVFAKNTEVFYADQLALVVTDRDIKVDASAPSNFVQTSGFQQHAPDLYSKEMVVDEIGNNVYKVGQGAVYSLFVVEGNRVVGVESYAGITQRFKALQDHLGRSLVFTDLVVTHHHVDHISGVPEIPALGSNIITVAEHKDTLISKLEQPISESKFKLVNSEMQLLGGKIKIFDIATAHSSHNLVAYIPGDKLLFAADHYRSSHDNEKLVNFPDLIKFKHAIDSLNIPIKKFASVHGIHTLDYKTLAETTQKPEFDCSPYPSVCLTSE